MKPSDQLSMFEPEGVEALMLMKQHATAFQRAHDEADFWDSCLCPGARDTALQQADASYRAWLIFAILLDLEREAQL